MHSLGGVLLSVLYIGSGVALPSPSNWSDWQDKGYKHTPNIEESASTTGGPPIANHDLAGAFHSLGSSGIASFPESFDISKLPDDVEDHILHEAIERLFDQGLPDPLSDILDQSLDKLDLALLPDDELVALSTINMTETDWESLAAACDDLPYCEVEIYASVTKRGVGGCIAAAFGSAGAIGGTIFVASTATGPGVIGGAAVGAAFSIFGGAILIPFSCIG